MLQAIFYLFSLSLLSGSVTSYTVDGQCTSATAAANCDSNYLCCDKNFDCGSGMDDCQISNGGIPYSGHCIYLFQANKCSSCCVLSKRGHYCATKSECDDLQMRWNIVTAVIVIYCVLVGTLIIWGCFKRHYVKKHIKKIYEESAKYDSKRQHDESGGGLIGAIKNVGNEIVSHLR